MITGLTRGVEGRRHQLSGELLVCLQRGSAQALLDLRR